MPRPQRVELAGGVYHVIARGNERKDVVRDDVDRMTYLERLTSCRERLGFRIYAYCLMSNHVHLAIERGPEPLSRIMLTLQSSYTQRFNRRHDRVGHLFQGRYKAFLVERDRYLFALVRYIHRNPVEAGVVEDPAAYRWSSDRFYRGGLAPEWLDTDRVLRMFNRRMNAARAAYRRLVDGSTGRVYEEAPTVRGVIVGDDEYAHRVLNGTVDAPAPRRARDIESVVRIVASERRIPLAELRRKGHAFEPSAARAIAAYLGRRELRIPISAMARYFGREESAMSRGALKVEAARRDDPVLRERIERMAARLGVERAKIHG